MQQRGKPGISRLADFFKLSGVAVWWVWTERMRLLVRIIADHRPLGIASAMPYDLYQRVLGKNPDKAIAHPYYVSFYGLIAFVAEDLAAKGLKEKVRGAKLAAVSTCHGRLVPAISIIGVCAFRYRTFAGLYSYNFVSQDSDVGQRHLSKTKYP